MFSFLKKQNHKKRLKQLMFIVITLIVLISLLLFYLYRQSNMDPEIKTQKEVQSLVSDVSKLIELPEGEIPTVATVLDKDKVSGELFFKNAMVGDKLLAYVKARKAILYRPSTNKIVEVAPIVVSEIVK